MAFKLEIDLETLKTENIGLNALIGDLTSEIGNMQNLIQQMTEYWEGDAAQAYIAEMNRRCGKTIEARNQIQEFHNAVETQIEKLDNADNWLGTIIYEILNW